MAKGSGAVAAAFIGSIILSLLGAGAAGYFLLPMLFPGMRAPAFLYKEFDSVAQKTDNELTWTMVPDTSINITIRENSRILCSFSSSYLLGVSNTLGIERISWEVTLEVNSVGNMTAYITYWDNAGVTNNREISSSFDIDYATGFLSEGEYTVRVMWRSLSDRTGLNYLLFNTPLMDYNRSLSAIEILT